MRLRPPRSRPCPPGSSRVATLPYQATPAASVRIVCGVHPDNPATPAEAGDAQLATAAIFRSPRGRRIEVGHHLRIGHFGNDVRIRAWMSARLGRVTLPREEFRRDGQVPLLGEPARDILDVLVHAEDLRTPPAPSGSPVLPAGCARYADHPAPPGRNPHFAGRQSLRVGRDHRLCLYRQHRRRKARAERGLHEPATVEAQRRLQAVEIGPLHRRWSDRNVAPVCCLLHKEPRGYRCDGEH